jgi:protein-S-isoprenylcysteine O-methyltransferase Ste14
MTSVALVTAICLAFAFIHSLCVTSFIKNVVRRLLGEVFVKAFYRLLYTCFGFATTAVAVYLILRIPDEGLFAAPAWLRWPMHALQAGALIFGALSFRAFSAHEFLGLTQAWRYITKKEVKGDVEGISEYGLVRTGVYGIVRHPMYLAGIVIFTLNPYVSVNRLTVSFLADAYFVYGALMEERRLIGRFGDDYRNYMKEVPRFIPRFRRTGRKSDHSG